MYYIGQELICIDAELEKGRSWEGPALIKNATYTIRDFVECHHNTEEVCIRLVEIIRNNKPDINVDLYGFRISRFRPIVKPKTDISIFKKLLLKRELETC